MFRTSRRSSVVIAVLALAFAFAGGGAAAAPLPSTVPAQALPSGFRALTGAEAAAFTVPGDMELVRTMQLPAYDLAYERYQQFFGPVHAEVLGAQVTLYRDPAGTIRTVIGSHYPKIAPTNAIGLTKAAAAAVADRDTGPGGDRRVDLLIDPASGRYFYRVETRRLDSRWFHWVDAVNGQLLNRYDGIANDHGTGVKGDTKDINGPDNVNTADDLTTYHNASGHGASGPHWDLFSTDNRQKTYDARNGTTFAYYTTDLDNHWDLVTSTRKSPGQPALVDAQFYANATDDYYQSRHTFDWLGCYPSAMQSVAHYSRNYNNAFWNGTYTIYGDGDGVSFREFSGALDVVAHEQTHGVTDCTSNLVYQDESGALNESFSDQMGNAAEFFAAEPTTTNCVLASGQVGCADWWIAEDVYLSADTVPGFRNMKDPEEDGDPDHYTERQIGGGDNGGVHSNSGIPNHAFYLLVNGGLNASCASPATRNAAHCSDADTQDNNLSVTAIGITDAEKIFFSAFTGLPTNATMCQARTASETNAASRFGAGSQQRTSTRDAWVAVGLTDLACGLVAPPAAPTVLAAVDHPADNGGAIDLTWTPSATAGVTQQRLYRSTTSGSGYSLVVTFNDNTTSSYTNTGLVNGTNYFYVVRAFNGQESANSNEASAASVDNLAPNAPTSLSAADRPGDGGGALDLGWTISGSTDVTQQRIYRGTSSGVYGVSPIATLGPAANSYTDTGRTDGVTYYYVVRAYDGTQEGANSNEASAAPVDNPPAAPTGLVATPGDAQVSLDWNDNTEPDLASYSVYRSTTSGIYDFTGPVASGLITSAYVDMPVVNGVTYFYVVTAVDSGGNASPPSGEAFATPQASAGNSNNMYVWDIAFESRTRGKGGSKHDERIAVTVRRDSNANGVAEATDALVPSASVSVTVFLELGPSVVASFSGTTDSTGVFRTGWMLELANGTYTAEVTVLTHASYNWDQSLDPTPNDTDVNANNLPDQQHTIPH